MFNFFPPLSLFLHKLFTTKRPIVTNDAFSTLKINICQIWSSWKIRTDTSIAIDENIILETIPIFAPTAEDSAVSLLR